MAREYWQLIDKLPIAEGVSQAESHLCLATLSGNRDRRDLATLESVRKFCFLGRRRGKHWAQQQVISCSSPAHNLSGFRQRQRAFPLGARFLLPITKTERHFHG